MKTGITIGPVTVERKTAYFWNGKCCAFSSDAPDIPEISVRKAGEVREYVVSDLKPCTEAVVSFGEKEFHIDRALFDTGSNVTILNPNTIPPDTPAGGEAYLHGPDSSWPAKPYYCTVSLGPGNIILDNVPVIDFNLEVFDTVDIDLIIGMDIITLGELIVKRKGRIPVFHFRINQ